MHNYHDTFNMLPPTTMNPGAANCDTFLPANTMIMNHTAYMYLLPFVEQGAIFDQINFSLPSGIARHGTNCSRAVDATWPNQIALNHEVAAFLCPSDVLYNSPRTSVAQGVYSLNPGHRTTYGFVTSAIETATAGTWARTYREVTHIGKSAWWHNGAAKFRDLVDGTTNTMLMIETPTRKTSANYGPYWNTYTHTMYIVPTRGINLPHPAVPPQPYVYAWGACSAHPGGAQMVLGDGSVRFISDSVDMVIVASLVSIGGREVIGEF